MPYELKIFEIVKNNGEASQIHNPHFIEELKTNGFENGNVTEINFASRVFKYKFVGTSPTAFQFAEV